MPAGVRPSSWASPTRPLPRHDAAHGRDAGPHGHGRDTPAADMRAGGPPVCEPSCTRPTGMPTAATPTWSSARSMSCSSSPGSHGPTPGVYASGHVRHRFSGNPPDRRACPARVRAVEAARAGPDVRAGDARVSPRQRRVPDDGGDESSHQRSLPERAAQGTAPTSSEPTPSLAAAARGGPGDDRLRLRRRQTNPSAPSGSRSSTAASAPGSSASPRSTAYTSRRSRTPVIGPPDLSRLRALGRPARRLVSRFGPCRNNLTYQQALSMLRGGKGLRELTKRQQDVLGFITSFSRSRASSDCSRDRRPLSDDAARGLRSSEGARAERGSQATRERWPNLARSHRGCGPRNGTSRAGCPSWGASPPARRSWRRSIGTGVAYVPEALPGRPEDFFALRVRGESMIGAHICDGDLVVVRSQDSAQPNDIVVAVLGDGGRSRGHGEALRSRRDRGYPQTRESGTGAHRRRPAAREPSRSSARSSASSGVSSGRRGRNPKEGHIMQATRQRYPSPRNRALAGVSGVAHRQ